jgi:class 3 adenylate cyclase
LCCVSFAVETIGDAYICASGLPIPDEDNAELIANFAVAVLHCSSLVLSPLDGQPIQLRIGIHSGQCSAGVVGNSAPRFCVFGDVVNTTSRHESTGMPGRIHCSSATFGNIFHFSKREKQQFSFTPRGLIDMKGKGQMFTYWLDGGTADNEQTNPDALHKLSEEVEEMLATKLFRNRRYFSKQGRNMSMTMSNYISDDSMSVISSLAEYDD